MALHSKPQNSAFGKIVTAFIAALVLAMGIGLCVSQTAWASGGRDSTSHSLEGVKKLKPTADNFDFAAPENLVYDGTSKVATVTVKSEIEGMGAVTVKYYKDSSLDDSHKDAGKYVVKIDVEEGEGYQAASNITAKSWSFKITRAPQTMDVPEVESQTADSITLKEVTGKYGDITYGYKVKGSEGEVSWQSSRTFTGLSKYISYAFYAQCAGDDNHNSKKSSYLTASINVCEITTEGETKGGYASVAKAIKAAGTNAVTIKLILDSNESILFGADQNITLDLNGYVLEGTGTKNTIGNAGTLKIQDSRASVEHHFINSGDYAGLWVWDKTEQSAAHVVQGGCVTGGKSTKGAGINNSGTLTIEGGNVVGNLSDGDESVFGGGIYSTNQLVMSGGSVVGNLARGATVYGGGIYAKGTTTLTGSALISENTASGTSRATGGGLMVSDALTISGNATTGVLISKNTVECTNGANALGGGAYVKDGGENTIVIENCIIKDNVAKNTSNFADTTRALGGGLNLNTSNVELKQTVAVIGNKAINESPVSGENERHAFGGGIFVGSDTSLTIASANVSVKGNVADGSNNGNGTALYKVQGGGIQLTSSSSCKLTNGSITGNTVKGYVGEDYDPRKGGGVCATYDSIPFEVGGKVVVTGNFAEDKVGAKIANNVFLRYDDEKTTYACMTILSGQDAPQTGMKIGITRELNPITKTLGTGEITGANSADYSAYFESDKANYKVYNTGTGSNQILILSPHVHTWNYSADGASLKAWCSEEFGATTECTEHHGEQNADVLTLVAPLHTVYGDGKSAEATFANNKTTFSGLDALPTIVYQVKNAGGTWSILSAAPVNAGNYRACITVGTGISAKTAYLEYTIAKRTITFTSDSASKTYDGEALTAETVSVKGLGFADGESVEYNFGVGLKDVGSLSNVFAVNWTDALESNYDATYVYGTLTVNPAKEAEVKPDAEALEKIEKALQEEYPDAVIAVAVSVSEEAKDIDAGELALLKEKTGNKKLDTVNVELVITVDGVKLENAGDTNGELIKIVYAFDFTNKTDVQVLRAHTDSEGKTVVVELTETPNEDGEYVKFDKTAGTITIVAKKYSTYSFAYNEVEEKIVDTGDSTGFVLGAASLLAMVSAAVAFVVRRRATE